MTPREQAHAAAAAARDRTADHRHDRLLDPSERRHRAALQRGRAERQARHTEKINQMMGTT